MSLLRVLNHVNIERKQKYNNISVHATKEYKIIVQSKGYLLVIYSLIY